MRTTLFLLTFYFGLSTSFAQEGVLVGDTTYRAAGGNYAATLPMTSLTYRAPPQARQYKLDDIVVVRVLEEQDYSNTANNQRKRDIKMTTRLSEFFTFGKVFGMPKKMDSEDLPGVAGEINIKYQNNGSMTRKERYKTTVTCRVKTVHDNGLLTIEGTKRRRNGEESQHLYVLGTADPRHIDAEGMIDSSMLLDSDIEDRPEGNVYDTVRRPWGTRILEHWSPF